MIKKLISFIIAAILSVTLLASCGKDDSSSQAEISKASSSFSSKVKVLGGAALGIGAFVLVPSMIRYTNKAKLSSANSNAKMLYTAVTYKVADLTADGEESLINGCSKGRAVKLSEPDKSNPVDAAIAEALYTDGRDAEIYFELDSNNKVTVAQWRQDADSQVGQYPRSNTQANENYSFGIVN